MTFSEYTNFTQFLNFFYSRKNSRISLLTNDENTILSRIRYPDRIANVIHGHLPTKKRHLVLGIGTFITQACFEPLFNNPTTQRCEMPIFNFQRQVLKRIVTQCPHFLFKLAEVEVFSKPVFWKWKFEIEETKVTYSVSVLKVVHKEPFLGL